MKALSMVLAVFTVIGVIFLPGTFSQAQAADDLEGTTWQLVSLDSEPMLPDSSISLEFDDDNRFGGTGGCNSYGGTYEVNDVAITFSELFSTRMFCAGLMEQERAYFDALEETVRYEIAGHNLILENADGERLIFEPVRDLIDTEWQLILIGESPVIEESVVTLQFGDDAHIGGSGGCNSFGAPYEMEEDTLTIGTIISTMMACLDDGIMEQEQVYFDALQSASRYEIDRDQLIIDYGESEQLVFARINALAGTEWELVTLGEESVVEGTVVTIQFDDDNHVSGSGGCNSFGGPYTIEDNTISFGMLASTLMACMDDNIMEQEQAFFEALNTANRYEIDGDQLIIDYGEAEQLVFQRRDNTTS